MGSYEFLAGCYDELTTDVGYARWADFLERIFARGGRRVHTVLDLACGTGSLTRELALRGYEMIGVDRSEEMLCQAAESAGISPSPPSSCASPWSGWTSTARWTPACAAWTVSTMSPGPASWPGPLGGCACFWSRAGCFFLM